MGLLCRLHHSYHVSKALHERPRAARNRQHFANARSDRGVGRAGQVEVPVACLPTRLCIRACVSPVACAHTHARTHERVLARGRAHQAGAARVRACTSVTFRAGVRGACVCACAISSGRSESSGGVASAASICTSREKENAAQVELASSRTEKDSHEGDRCEGATAFLKSKRPVEDLRGGPPRTDKESNDSRRLGSVSGCRGLARHPPGSEIRSQRLSQSPCVRRRAPHLRDDSALPRATPRGAAKTRAYTQRLRDTPPLGCSLTRSLGLLACAVSWADRLRCLLG
eukprot:3280075-Pleurochrysis_carterae.AAC.1